MVPKQLNIKNRTYYFWDYQINIKNFNPALLKLDKKSSVGANIYYIGYVTKKPEYNINSVNPLYLVIDEIDGFIELNSTENGTKHLNIVLTDSNTEVVLKFRILTIVIRCIFEKDGKYYPQIFLDNSLYEL